MLRSYACHGEEVKRQACDSCAEDVGEYLVDLSEAFLCAPNGDSTSRVESGGGHFLINLCIHYCKTNINDPCAIPLPITQERLSAILWENIDQHLPKKKKVNPPFKLY